MCWVPNGRVVLSGYPPKQLVVADTDAIAGFVNQGDTITIKTGSAGSAPSASAPAIAPAKPPVASNSPTAESLAAQGTFVERVVPDDNSCLFRSVNGVLGNPSAPEAPLRVLISNAVAADPTLYNEAFLGRPNLEYQKWIQTQNAWGGAIELGILAAHHRIELAAFDVKTMRMDRYGEGNGFSNVGFLMYDGIHYNYLALILNGVSSSDTTMDITQFDTKDAYAISKARAVAQAAHDRRQFTDTASFTLKCGQCGTKLKGETGALEHAKTTGHSQFEEA